MREQIRSKLTLFSGVACECRPELPVISLPASQGPCHPRLPFSGPYAWALHIQNHWYYLQSFLFFEPVTYLSEGTLIIHSGLHVIMLCDYIRPQGKPPFDSFKVG